MKKIFLLLVSMIMLTACHNEPKTAIDMTVDELRTSFNEVAKDTEFKLGEVGENDDGTVSLATVDKTARVICDIGKNGKITEINVQGSGIFQPGLASYDYMVYTMMACDDTVDLTGADGFVADLYYEATSGQDAVMAGYNGLEYSFLKGGYDCWFTIKNKESEVGK